MAPINNINTSARVSKDPAGVLLNRTYVCVLQLILPECMKLLPVYLNCVLKSDVLMPGADASLDDRAYLRQLISCMDVSESHVFFYPRLLPLVRPHKARRVDTHTHTLPVARECVKSQFKRGSHVCVDPTDPQM